MASEKRSFLEKIGDWLKRHEARPYVKVRNLADPFGDRMRDPGDADALSDGCLGVEAGIKISF